MQEARNTWRIKQFEFLMSNSVRKFDSSNGRIEMRIIETQLFITCDDVVLETIQLIPGKNIIALCEGDSLTFDIAQHNLKRRIKVQLSCSNREIAVCVMYLRKFIKVRTSENENDLSTLTDKIEELLTTDVSQAITDSKVSLPKNYPLEAAIKLCIMDPAFPAFVENVTLVMKSLIDATSQSDQERQ